VGWVRVAARSSEGLTPPLLRVEWVDAATLDGWRGREDVLRSPGVAVCVTVGFLIHEDASELRLAQTVSDGSVNGVMSIPVGMVKSRKRLDRR